MAVEDLHLAVESPSNDIATIPGYHHSLEGWKADGYIELKGSAKLCIDEGGEKVSQGTY